MIRIENLVKSFRVRGHKKIVINNLTMELPSGRSLALLGRNGAGKSTLLQIIAGTLRPDTGHIVSDGSISWPVGFAGSFHANLTGVQNIRFVARVYGVDSDELCEFVRDFSELGNHFYMPVRSYSSGMKARLAFGVSMGIHFDTYLVDEVTAVGDAVFRAKSRELFRDRMQTSSAILVSHDMGQVKNFCDSGVLLSDGKLQYFEDVHEAVEAHLELMARQRAQK
ncbi:ABC transporter ATP-binding protein [uncultured Shimia sp.]|uniref:ABC transporter ATP-binding protein n=1 Tax=uncultured Shimia sp. TaxID=573152 RepID=UPI0025D745D0|nr:ABC transporter ATP-binding protein [uncultured Shimia sp.]